MKKIEDKNHFVVCFILLFLPFYHLKPPWTPYNSRFLHHFQIFKKKLQTSRVSTSLILNESEGHVNIYATVSFKLLHLCIKQYFHSAIQNRIILGFFEITILILCLSIFLKCEVTMNV